MSSQFALQARLVSSTVTQADLDFVVSSGGLQPKHFLEVVEERTVAGRCGYPLCGHCCPTQEERETVRLDVRTKAIVADITSAYCSASCEARAKALLQRVEGAAHFGSKSEGRGGTVEEVMQAMDVALGFTPAPELGLVVGPPPAYANPAVSSRGAVVAPSTVFNVAGEEGDGAPKGVPKRIRQLKSRIVAESRAQQPQGASVAELMARFSNPSSDAGLDASLPQSHPSVSSSQISFAALNYSPSTVATRQQPETTKALAKPVESVSQPKAAKKKGKVVSWGEDVASPTHSAGVAVPRRTPAPASRATGNVRLVGEVVEKESVPRPTLYFAAGAGASIEGYEATVSRVLPRPERGAPAAVSTTDSEDDESATDGDDASTVDSADSVDYSTPLSPFSALWLASDDLLGGVLPLCHAYNRHDSSQHTDDSGSGSDLVAVLPELARELAAAEVTLALHTLAEDALSAYRDDVEFVCRYLTRLQPVVSRELSSSEWSMLALLLIDGVLRRRDVGDKQTRVVDSLQACVGRVGQGVEPLTEREVYHLRLCFCTLNLHA